MLLLLAATVARAADHATVFIYHRFGDARYPSTNTSLADFRAHLEILRHGGYSVLPPGEIADRLRSGDTASRPVRGHHRGRCLSLVSDRGGSTAARVRVSGDPVCQFRRDGRTGLPELGGVASLARSGIEIGNHSAAHGYLLDRLAGEDQAAWRRRISSEIEGAQQALTTRLGVAPRLFAYPYGEFSRELITVVRELGFHDRCRSAVRGHRSRAWIRLLCRVFRPAAVMPRSSRVSRAAALPCLADDDPDAGRYSGRRGESTGVADQARCRAYRPGHLADCYVPGQPPVKAVPVDRLAGIYEVRAPAPLTERRSKYTFTATDREGNWYWFSHLWVRPRQ